MGNAQGKDKGRHPSGDSVPTMRSKFAYDESSEFSSGQLRNMGRNSDAEFAPRMRAATMSTATTEVAGAPKLPTVFKWTGPGKNVFISGSFDNWKEKRSLQTSQGELYTIIDLTEGTHQYKFYVDGAWVCDNNEPLIDNGLGSMNNIVSVKPSDFEVFEALAMDGDVPGQKQSALSGSPPGEYSQEIPSRNSGHMVSHSGPPILPPHLLQVILNKETSVHCEPTLLPEPNHVMLNHLYALSIKDGVMVMCATHRYRKKFVTTVLYSPISD